MSIDQRTETTTRKRITLTSDEAIDLLRLIDHHAQLAIEESRRLPDRGAKAGLGGCYLIRDLIAEHLGPATTADAYCRKSEEIDGGIVGPEFSTSGPGSGWSRNHDVTDFAERALSEDYGALGYLDLDDGRLSTRDRDTGEVVWTDASIVRLVAPAIDYLDRRNTNPAWCAAVRDMAREAAETHAAKSDVAAWQRIVAWLDEESAEAE